MSSASNEESGRQLPPSAAATAAAGAHRAPSPLERLQLEPTRFSIDQAVAVLAPGRDPVDVSFVSSPRLATPGGEVVEVRPASSELVTPTFGLIGPGGVLPRHYTARVDGELRKRSTALHAFIDLLARRFTGLFVKAGAKHRPTREPRLAQAVQAAAIGLESPYLASGLRTALPALLYHSGGLAARSRSSERLRGMLSEETGAEVDIVEFAGGWVRLPMAEQTRLAAAGLPGCHVRLGVDAALGSQVWDPPSRFLIRLGPLNLPAFEALLPGAPLHTRLVELTRLHVGLEMDFAFNPGLAAPAVPALRLSASGGARLGWTSWLTTPRPRRQPAKSAILQAVSP